MFGRLPWLALERRMRALRFLVFFDIGAKAIGQQPERHKANLGWSPQVIASRIGRAIFAVVGADIGDTFILPDLTRLGFLASNWRDLTRANRRSGHCGGDGRGDDGSQRCS